MMLNPDQTSVEEGKTSIHLRGKEIMTLLKKLSQGASKEELRRSLSSSLDVFQRSNIYYVFDDCSLVTGEDGEPVIELEMKRFSLPDLSNEFPLEEIEEETVQEMAMDEIQETLFEQTGMMISEEHLSSLLSQSDNRIDSREDAITCLEEKLL